MLSTSVLSIKWTIKGKPKSLLVRIGGDLVVRVNSQFTLNQISGQVIEHEEVWDLSGSSPIAQAYFWASRRLFATTEAGKDFADTMKSSLSTEKRNMEIYPDPSGDPTKVTSFWYQSEISGTSMFYELFKWHIFSYYDALSNVNKEEEKS